MPKLNSPHNADDKYKTQELGDIAHGGSISQGSFNPDKAVPSFNGNKVDAKLLRNQPNTVAPSFSPTRSKSQVTSEFDRLSKNEMTTKYN